MKQFILILFIACISFTACQSDDPADNPFDAVSNGGNGGEGDTLDPESIAGLHKQIFAVRCANPLCHDGSFEPDFRTIQSTYNNLVYHQVIKNTINNDFTYRVLPYDPGNSWLIERLTTTDPVLGQMPLYADPLSEKQLGHIRDWINAGCPDINGQPAKFPNLKPQVAGRAAFDENQVRLDTGLSGGRFSPFIIAEGTRVTMYFVVRDDSTAPQNLTINEAKFSYDRNDFSSPISVKKATYFTQDFFVIQFDAAEFQSNVPVYFRYYVKDEHNSTPTEFPLDGSLFYYKELFAFIIQ